MALLTLQWFCVLVVEPVRQKHARSVEWNAFIITINPDYFFLQNAPTQITKSLPCLTTA